MYLSTHLEDNLSTTVVPGIDLAIAPTCDEFWHPVPIQVIAIDGYGMVLGLEGRKGMRVRMIILMQMNKTIVW